MNLALERTLLSFESLGFRDSAEKPVAFLERDGKYVAVFGNGSFVRGRAHNCKVYGSISADVLEKAAKGPVTYKDLSNTTYASACAILRFMTAKGMLKKISEGGRGKNAKPSVYALATQRD